MEKMKILTIKTKDAEAKRIIINALKERYCLYPDENLDFEMKCYFPSEIILKIITELILCNKIGIVELYIDSNVQGQKAEKRDEEKVKTTSKKRRCPTVTEKVKQYITDNDLEKLNIKEISKAMNMEEYNVRNALSNLKKQKFVLNPSKGVWLIKKEDTAEKKEDVGSEVEKEETAGEEINNEIKKGIFLNEKYEEIIQYIMGKRRFSIEGLRNKFKIEEEKIPIVVKELLEKEYIKEEMIGTYCVSLHIRMLYYILKNPRVTLAKISVEMPLEKKDEICKVLKQLEENKKILKTENGGYKIIRF